MARLNLYACLICLIAAPLFAAPADEFHALLDEHWETATREQIFFRSDPDAWRMNGKLSEHTSEARERRRQYNESVLVRLESIDPDTLGDKDRISYKIFRYEREIERESYDYYDHLFPMTALFGYHTYFADAPSAMSFLNAEDYERYVVSLADFPRYNREHIELMRDGIAAGLTQYCGAMKDYDRTISKHIVDDPRDSLLYGPFTRFPATVHAGQRDDLSARGTELIASMIVPGYRELLQFFNEEYMPNCRTSPGITSVEGGDEYYAYLVRYFTTTDLTPEAIHETGMSELSRIRAEMDAIIDELGFDGDFAAFLDYLRTEPRFFAETTDELLGRAALISKTAEGELPRFFGLLPRGTYNIKPNPGRGTYYMPSSGDGTTPGTYFVGTARLDAQPLYTLEALSLHEGVPGHHLQTALAMELGLPEFRRTLYHSAYGEGWGLYSERLGLEMGFYTDPYSDFGRLTYEAWRAARLAVDTGIHAFGWSRAEAIEFMLERAALTEFEVTSEIDRYITWPAQALSYKIGEIRIRELRRRAETGLGLAFDIRRFHDTVVGNGSLPIAVLEELVNEWIESEKGLP